MLKGKIRILGQEDFPPDMIHHYEVFDKEDIYKEIDEMMREDCSCLGDVRCRSCRRYLDRFPDLFLRDEEDKYYVGGTE